jgi:hypothetical protein
MLRHVSTHLPSHPRKFRVLHAHLQSMLPVGFEPTISAGERPQKNALDRAVTGTGHVHLTGAMFHRPPTRPDTLQPSK